MTGLRRALRLAFPLLLLLPGLPASSQSAYPELIPLPQAVSLALMEEPLPADAMIEAALVFSGTPATALERHRSTIQEAVQALRGKVEGITDETTLGETALAFLHERFLKSYSFPQMRVDTLLDDGVFNCVSSAALYMILARSVGLSVKAVKTSDHAFCTVLVKGGSVDVETTSPYGFNPGSKKEFKDQFGKTTGYAYVPATGYSSRKTIGQKELLGLILVDSVALEAGRGNFLAAVQPAVSVYALTGTDEFARIRTSALSNYAVVLSMEEKFDEALEFIDVALASFGSIPELLQRRIDLSHNRIVTLLDGNRFDEASALLGTDAASSGLEADDWTTFSVYIAQKRAEAGYRSKGYREALAILEEILQRLGKVPALLKSYESYVHNQFAALYNSRKFEDARAVLTAGLAVHPQSALLVSDGRTLDKTGF